MQKPCSLRSTIRSLSREGQCLSQGVPLPSSQLLPNADWGPAFPSAHHSERSGAANPNAMCTVPAAEGVRGSWHVRMVQGFHTAAVVGAAGPRARMASLIYLQLAVRACVFAHIYISLPLIIHLASFKGALQSQRAVLGFITFISCISPAGLANNASLKHSLAEERGLPLSQGRFRAAFCPGQAPPDFLLCIQIEWTLCQVGYLLTYKVGNESKAWE